MEIEVRDVVKLAPDVPALEALGASVPEDLFCLPPRVATGARAQQVGRAFRVPLPGTPDEHGRQHERPRGAGTGHLLVERFVAGGLDEWRVRFTHPRSSSRAARHWNLICHVVANGITAPALVALLERRGGIGSVLATRDLSVLITRELDDFEPLTAWLARERSRDVRRRGLKSLGLTLAQVLRCGAWLPRTTLANLRIQTPEAQECVAVKLANLGAEQQLVRGRGLARARLPAIAVTEFEDGRILSTILARRRGKWLAALLREAGSALSPRERYELLLRVAANREQARELAQKRG